MSICLAGTRAAASRRNGARSCGPKSPEGKARSSQNALRHGLRAQKFVVVAGESAAAFDAFEAALIEELAPEGVLQNLLAGRIARAAWRLERAERIEGELLHENIHPGGSLGLALIRDGNGTRSFETLLRYRGAAMAELWRALRLLKALQGEMASGGPESLCPKIPNEPEVRRNPEESAPEPSADEPEKAEADGAARCVHPVPAAARRAQDAATDRNQQIPAGSDACRKRKRAAEAARRME